MKRKFLTTTLLSMSLLSLNVFAGTKTKCTGGFCMVDLSSVSPKIEKQQSNKNTINKDGYKIVMLDNIETIVFSKEKYIMTDHELGEYELENILHELVTPSLNKDHLPGSEYYCEDNLKAVKVLGIANTYECT
jgi:hypothetical protein